MRNGLTIPTGRAATRQDFTHKILEDLRLRNTNFRQSLFIGAILKNCHFHSVRFDRCDFSGTKLIECTFEKCSFVPDEIRSCVVTKCVFDQCDFRGAQWSGVVTDHTKFTACDFRETTVRDSTFTLSDLSFCPLKRSSITLNDFSNCKFTEVDFGDCTALFLFFIKCKFNKCRINAETIGFTYGLSNEDLETLEFIYLGRPQERPQSTTLLKDLIATYDTRRWSVGACVLKLNFGRAMPLLALRELGAALEITIDRELPFDWDELRFLAQVLGHLQREQRLPLAGLWLIASTLNRAVLNGQSHAISNVSGAAEIVLRQLDRLVLEILDEITPFPIEPESHGRDFLLDLKLSNKPYRELNELILPAIYRAFDASEIAFIRGQAGSWAETWQLSLNALMAVQVALVVVNGVVVRLTKILRNVKKLAGVVSNGKPKARTRKLSPNRKIRDQTSLNLTVSIAPLSPQIVATQITHKEPLALDHLARIETVIKVLDALRDDDLESFQSYAANRIESANARRAGGRAKRAGRERQPTV